ncbi:OsmC family protein [Paracoccus aerodenitrificans]|uniref:OsmC family protein n=1 Tax=Paracoccus aerodenitrificans TaxID=3017781 RepID=UPI0022F0A793|nr:OsmC family protein [Paracoccus aerodenitrificans]WBU65276.1 OsmC family protein [Paracoccus aerodenitrificans]
MITKTGSAKWQGAIKDGKGEVSTQSSALSSQPYGFATRFEDKPGTNPEELIGAAHASCFAMALSKELQEAGVTDVTIEASSAISMDKDGDGFAIKTAALTATVTGNGDRDAIRKAAEGAKSGCPVSKLLNADVTLDLKIA